MLDHVRETGARISQKWNRVIIGRDHPRAGVLQIKRIAMLLHHSRGHDGELKVREVVAGGMLDGDILTRRSDCGEHKCAGGVAYRVPDTFDPHGAMAHSKAMFFVWRNETRAPRVHKPENDTWWGFNLELIVLKSGGGLRPAAPLLSCVARARGCERDGWREELGAETRLKV